MNDRNTVFMLWKPLIVVSCAVFGSIGGVSLLSSSLHAEEPTPQNHQATQQLQATEQAINLEREAKAKAKAEAATKDKDTHKPVAVIERQKLNQTLSLGGTVTARKAVALTAQAPGRVSFVWGNEGDQFHAGTVLVRLSDEALRAKLNAAVARRDAAQAQIHNAQMQYQRELRSPMSNSASAAPGGMGMPAMMDQMFSKPMQNMMGMRSNNAERASDLSQRGTQVAQAQTQYREALAQIHELEASLRDIHSIAPFGGMIVTKHVEIGDTVQPGMPLISINANDGFQVQVDVPARLQPNLAIGMPVQVRIDGQSGPVTGKLARIFPVLDPSEHTVKVEIELPKEAPAVVGMYAEVLMPEGQAGSGGSLVIPESAISVKGGLPMVYLLDENNRAMLRIVRLGRKVDDEHLAVLSGVKEGDRIVCRPKPGLRSGDIVDVNATH